MASQIKPTRPTFPSNTPSRLTTKLSTATMVDKLSSAVQDRSKRAQSAKPVQHRENLCKPRRVQSATTRTRNYIKDMQGRQFGHAMQLAVYNPSPSAKPIKKVELTLDAMDSPNKIRVSTKTFKTKTRKNLTDASEQTPIAPQSLQPLAAYASSADSLPDYFNHPALKDSVVLLPGLPCYGSDLPTVPAPHGANEDYPYTHKLATNTLANAKKYSHPYFERIQQIKGWTCDHSSGRVLVNSVSGHTIHAVTVTERRGPGQIRDEIIELERLMKGLSTDWSTMTIACYQNEINNLQKQVKKTLSMAPECPLTPDPTGLRRFCKEYDTALQALRQRHAECMSELHQTERTEHLFTRAKLLDGS